MSEFYGRKPVYICSYFFFIGIPESIEHSFNTSMANPNSSRQEYRDYSGYTIFGWILGGSLSFSGRRIDHRHVDQGKSSLAYARFYTRPILRSHSRPAGWWVY
jgi:hypothetical protein